ncbi:MAG: 8-amino-7-oxononanoate synthase [Gallionellaceae bacterium]
MPFNDLQKDLNALAARGLLRRRRVLDSPQGVHVSVDGKPCLSFCSNDYLGLANHPQLLAALQQGAQKFGAGAGASHLVSGHSAAHHELEQACAAFVGKPAALLFSSGYLANLGAVQALVGHGDTVFADKLNHASLNDAMLLSRAAVKRYRHKDVEHLTELFEQSSGGRKLVITDAVFSMDGDVAPLPELLALCEQHDAWLLVDDAHGFGVLGEQGRGSLSHFGLNDTSQIRREQGEMQGAAQRAAKHTELAGAERVSMRHSRSPAQHDLSRIIYMATLGKAAGVSGAFVAAEQVVIDTLVQKARSYIYTTASPPALACALLASLALLREEEWRREHLQKLIAQLRAGLAGLPWKLMPSATPIQPLLVGGNQDAVALSEGLRGRGIWAPAIRPPTVPQGGARIRISLSAAHGEPDVAQLIGALGELAY